MTFNIDFAPGNLNSWLRFNVDHWYKQTKIVGGCRVPVACLPCCRPASQAAMKGERIFLYLCAQELIWH